jgi:uncharacterized membrane protein YqjE
METLDQEFRPTKVMSVTDWVITVIIQAIPLVGLIMLFVWAFSGNDNPNRQNYAKAVLLVLAVILVLGFVISLLFSGILLAMLSE